MNEIKIKKMDIELPTWDLSDIYKNIDDPKIDNDIKKIKNLSQDFATKWKGKIKDLNESNFLDCIENYQNIVESIYKISTHSSLIFATNMEDPEISKYNSSISDKLTEISSLLVFVKQNLYQSSFSKLRNQ